MWIRRFAASDAAPCAALFHRAVHEGAREHYSSAALAAWSPKVPATEDFARRLGDVDCFVADDGAVQGFMSLTPLGYLDMAFVSPEHRRTGLASQLYAAILNTAHMQGLSRLTTHASLYAQPFFSREGWQIEAPEEITRGDVKIRRFRMFIDLKE